MRQVYAVGGVVSLMFVAVGIFWLWKLGLFGTGLSICILGLVTGPSLGLGLYVFYLRDRIATLEKRLK
jgi:hypothetical protein